MAPLKSVRAKRHTKRGRSQDPEIPDLDPPKAEKRNRRNPGFGPMQTGKDGKSEKKKTGIPDFETGKKKTEKHRRKEKSRLCAQTKRKRGKTQTSE